MHLVFIVCLTGMLRHQRFFNNLSHSSFFGAKEKGAPPTILQAKLFTYLLVHDMARHCGKSNLRNNDAQ